MQTQPTFYRLSGLMGVLGLVALLAGLVVIVLLPGIRYAAWALLALTRHYRIRENWRVKGRVAVYAFRIKESCVSPCVADSVRSGIRSAVVRPAGRTRVGTKRTVPVSGLSVLDCWYRRSLTLP